MFLSNLPKQYQDAAKSYIQQTMRKNTSGKNPHRKVTIIRASKFNRQLTI